MSIARLMILLAVTACADRTFSNVQEIAVCDGVINEDEEAVDEGFDQDDDGYFDDKNPDCTDTYAGHQLDCNDEDRLINPGADERCDGIDNDCDGFVDDEDPEGPTDGVLGYPDVDEDGFGDDEDAGSLWCALPEGYVEVAGDCDDGDTGAHPDAEEICGDGVDNDCQGGDEAC